MKKILIFLFLGFLFLPSVSFGAETNSFWDLYTPTSRYTETRTTIFTSDNNSSPKIGPTVEKENKINEINNEISNLQNDRDTYWDSWNKAQRDEYNQKINKLNQQKEDIINDKEYKDNLTKEEAQKRDQDPNNLAGSNFQLDVNSLTPGENKYSWWAKENINSIINKITKVLLLVIPSLAVLFIVYGAIKIILAWWDSSKVGTGKTIIQFNIIAVVLALLSYSIIQLVIWLLGWNI